MISDDPFDLPPGPEKKPGGITQIWIGGPENIPPIMQEWMQGVQAYCLRYDLPYRLLNGAACKSLLEEYHIPFNPDGGILSLSDMARICALKKWGGWYFDTDVEMRRPGDFQNWCKNNIEQEPGTVFYNGITHGWMYNAGVLYASGTESCLFLDAMLQEGKASYATIHASDGGWGIETTVQNMVHYDRQWVGWHQALPKAVCSSRDNFTMIDHKLYGTWWEPDHLVPGIRDANRYKEVSDL